MLRKLGRFQAALQDCKYALDLDPTYGKASLGGAASALQLGDFEQAARFYQTYCELLIASATSLAVSA